jgi:hypothetical protein
LASATSWESSGSACLDMTVERTLGNHGQLEVPAKVNLQSSRTPGVCLTYVSAQNLIMSVQLPTSSFHMMVLIKNVGNG